MLTQTEATIYLASQRCRSQKEWYRSYHTFNHGDYDHESRKPFGNLQAVKDDTLKERRTLTYSVKEDTAVLLLPIVGALHYNSHMNIQGTLDVGQAHVLYLHHNSRLEISNPYENELINFLHLWFTLDLQHTPCRKAEDHEFDLTINKNRLIPLYSTDETDYHHTRIYIGKFDGRKEETYRLKNRHKGIFIFIIEGAFEVQNRLLQRRDGLAIRNLDEMEFEALSNEAIILLIEQA